MKSSIISFFHQPKKVAAVSIVLALVIGIFGYLKIHKTPMYQFVTAAAGTIAGDSTGTNGVRNLTLGFVAGGRIKTVSVKAGDTVTTGEVLATLDAGNAAGAVTQARAAYEAAQANYQKIINGATGSAIDVAKAAVNAAQVNLDQVTNQQKTLVANAYSNLLNSTVQAQSNASSTLTPPTISGTYTKGVEGTITFTVNQDSDNGYLALSGLATGTTQLSSTIARPLGDSGLYVLFPSPIAPYISTTWTITLPNPKAPNYLANSNAYQSALQAQTQMTAQAKAALDQANASLAATASTARPEDVASGKAQVDSAYGALQIAQASYANTVITAPGNGSVTAVSITPGQIAAANAPAIELLATVASKEVTVMIPSNAVISRADGMYVMVKASAGVEERKITTGASDATNVEVISGLAAGDEVVIH
jgi:multidrug efflux pump subunit AcrA (membrane-fusion protein)